MTPTPGDVRHWGDKQEFATEQDRRGMTLLGPERQARSLGVDTIQVVCRNCGHPRQMTWAVARLMPRDDSGRPYTEVCHYCLNTERGVGHANEW